MLFRHKSEDIESKVRGIHKFKGRNLFSGIKYVDFNLYLENKIPLSTISFCTLENLEEVWKDLEDKNIYFRGKFLKAYLFGIIPWSSIVKGDLYINHLSPKYRCFSYNHWGIDTRLMRKLVT